MQMRNASRVGATCAIGGAALLFIGTYLHPMGADPNDPAAAFAEYAGDRLWVASHLVQLAGVAAMMSALLFLTGQLEARRRSGVVRIATAGAITSLALAFALQAVDGVALKGIVDTWAASPTDEPIGPNPKVVACPPGIFASSWNRRRLSTGPLIPSCYAT